MKTQKISINSLNLSYVDNEKVGPNVLFIHGNSLSSEVFLRQFESDNLMAYRLIAIDLPGHGESDRSNQGAIDYSFQGLTNIIKTFLDELQIESLTVVGYSLGGHIAIQSLSQIKSIKGIFLIATPPIGMPPRFDLAFHAVPELASLFQSTMDESISKMISDIFSKPDLPPAFLNQIIEKADPLFREEIGKIIFGGSNQDEIQTLNKYRGKKCIVLGEKDSLVNRNYLEGLKIEGLFGKQIHLIKDGGHMAPFFQYKEFNKLLEQFIKDVYQT